MSTQKLNELIKTAPEFSQWWSKNHAQIRTAFKRKRRLQLGWGLPFVAVQAVVAWSLFNLPLNFPLGLPMIMGTMCILLLGVLCVLIGEKHFKKWRSQWPKDSPKPLETLINPDDLLDGSGKEVLACDPLIQKALLEKIVHHPNPDVRAHASSLLALKSVDMPHLWWRALELVLEDIEKESSNTALTPEQQLDRVYVEIEKDNLIVSNTKSKLFHL